MADLDTLRRRGIPFRALVDGAGVAVSGTDTLAALRDEGMEPICEVDETGTGVVGSETAATLRNRGIPVFCEVGEDGLASSGHTLPQLRDRGILGLAIVGLDGIAQGGSLTIAQLRERGIASFCPVDEDGVETGLGTARITLTGQIVAENTANGTTVGTLATVNTTGTAAFTLTDTAGGRFSLTGALLKVADSTLLNYETNQFHSITVSVTGVTPTIANRTFLIAVTNVLEVTLAALTLDDSNVVEDDVAGTVVGAILGKTSGSEIELTDSDGGRYAISGTNLVVGSTALVAGTDSVTIRETHGDGSNSPRDTVLSITVTAPLEAAPDALVLTWVSDPDDNTPVIDAVGDIVEGDTIRFEFDTVNTFDSGDLETGTNTVDAAEDLAEELDFTIGTLADDTWYARARIERPGHENSAWSNIVSETIVTTPAYTGPGDLVPSAVGWWGLRAYSAAQCTGSVAAIRIVKTIDGTAAMDINILANGSLDVATIAGLGYAVSVTTLYDQSGGGKHLTQTTLGLMPDLLLADLNTRPVMSFSVVTHHLANATGIGAQAQPNSISFVFKKVTDVGGNQNFFSDGTTSAIVTPNPGTNVICFYNGGSVAGVTATDGVFHAAQFIQDHAGTGSFAYIDGSNTSTNIGGTTGWAATAIRLGSGVVFSGAIFKATEVGFWTTGFSSGDADLINDNQTTYYGPF